jgi:hypothetical protein
MPVADGWAQTASPRKETVRIAARTKKTFSMRR